MFLFDLGHHFQYTHDQRCCGSKSRKGRINNMPPQDSPYFDHTGTMIIPFSADPKYHYWNGGQPLLRTISQLNVSEDVWAKHTEEAYPGNKA